MSKQQAFIPISQIAKLRASHLGKGFSRTLRKATSTSLRDMTSEASKRVRVRKRLKARDVKPSLIKRKNQGRELDNLEWGLDIKGKPVPLSKYPHRQLKAGVKVQVNRGTHTLLKSAFIATMASGHKGVFIRRGPLSLPIKELLGSRPVDALLHAGEAERVALRGRVSLFKTFDRLVQAELDKK